jgi:hypothetical protein
MDYAIVHQDKLCPPKELVEMFVQYAGDLPNLYTNLRLCGMQDQHLLLLFKLVEIDRRNAASLLGL